MTARPILMSPESMRAILDGKKTQTRRVMKPQPSNVDASGQWYRMPSGGESLNCYDCPYGAAGDTLWVKEPWAADAPLDEARAAHEDVMGGMGYGPYYRADKEHEHAGLTWRNAMYMPRWASRLSLRITKVRVQRLQDIIGLDVLAEGVEFPDGTNPQTAWRDRWAPFRTHWDAINTKRGFGWSVNPWVWAISFEVLP